MPLINDKQVNTAKHDGKIFVLECGCNKESKTPYLDSAYKFGSDNILLYETVCDKCGYNPWIILPKKENK